MCRVQAPEIICVFVTNKSVFVQEIDESKRKIEAGEQDPEEEEKQHERERAEKRPMLNDELRANLSKQGYKLIGTHRWVTLSLHNVFLFFSRFLPSHINVFLFLSAFPLMFLRFPSHLNFFLHLSSWSLPFVLSHNVSLPLSNSKSDVCAHV